MLTPPLMSRSPVNASEPIRTILVPAGATPSDVEMGWTTTLIDPHNVTGDVSWSIWVHVPDNAVSIPTRPGSCRWFTQIGYEQPGRGAFASPACQIDPGLVPPGDLRIDGDVPQSFLHNFDMRAGGTLSLWLRTNIISPTGPVEILSGSPDYDTELVLPGLQEPIAATAS